MALTDCITKLRAAGKLTGGQAEKIAERAVKLKNIYRNSGKYSEIDLQVKSEQDALSSMLDDIKASQYAEALQVQKIQKRTKNINEHTRGKMVGMRDELRKTENLGDAIYSQAVSNMYRFAEKFRSKVGGGLDRLFTNKNNALMRDVVRSLHGDVDVIAEARPFADMYKGAQDFLFDRTNRAGVRKHKLENFGVSHRWDTLKLRSAGKSKFISDMIEKLDRKRMVSPAGQPISHDDLVDLLDESFDTITTGGLNKAVKSGKAARTGSSTIKSRASASRVLHFKDGATWLDMHDKYGLGDLYENMLDTLKAEAQDIAILERFGPNPDRVFDMLDSAARFETQQAKVGKRTLGEKLTQAVRPKANRHIWNMLSGRSEGVINPLFAESMATMRNLMASAKLGKAAIASIADQAHLAKEIGLWGGSYTKLIGRMLKQLAPGGKMAREQAARMGLGLEWAHSRALTANRFTEMDSIGKFSRLAQSAADFTIRTTGLSSLTRAGREAFGIELNGLLASNRSKSFTELSSKIREGFTLHNITSDDWDVLRATVSKVRGTDFIDIEKLTLKDQDLSSKYLAMTHKEMRLAVPEPDIAIRSAITGGAAKGSFRRELGATFGQFKAFPITVFNNLLQQTLFDPRLTGKLSRGVFAAKLALYSTFMGALAIQLRAAADGKDFFDPNSVGFWSRAVAMGGAFGLAGDYLDNVPTDAKNVAYQLTGPVGSLALTVTAGIVGKNISKSLQGKETTLATDFVQLGRRNLPGKTFYTQLALERLIFDQLQSITDKKFTKNYRRYKKKLQKDTGQKYFWEPGKVAPKRAPTIAEVK